MRKKFTHFIQFGVLLMGLISFQGYGMSTPFSEFFSVADEKVITVYPNPAIHSCMVQFPEEAQYTVRIIFLSGQVKLQKTGYGNTIELPLTELNGGTYIIYVEKEGTDEKWVKQLSVER